MREEAARSIKEDLKDDLKGWLYYLVGEWKIWGDPLEICGFTTSLKTREPYATFLNDVFLVRFFS